MAFSAQTDHGQNERKDAVLCGISQDSSKGKTKFVPNPAAKPFVPSNLNSTLGRRSNRTWTTTCEGQNSKVFSLGGNVANLKAMQMVGQFIHASPQPYMNGPLNNMKDHVPGKAAQLISNGYPQDEPGTPTTPQPNKHIALHLVSKVLDDESIFNFTSFEETTPGAEPFSPLSCILPDGFDGTSHSWPMSTLQNGSIPVPTTSVNPGRVTGGTSYGSFPGQNIWSAETHAHTTPPLSPVDMSPPSSLTNSSLGTTPPFPPPPLIPASSLTNSSGSASPTVNGYCDDLSPYPSPTGQPFGSQDASPHSMFMPIQEGVAGGNRGWNSSESGYYSSNGSYRRSQPSPSSGPSHSQFGVSPKARPQTLTFSNGNHYGSSPSMSPSSPPSGSTYSHPGAKQMHTSQDMNGGPWYKHTSVREHISPSPSPRDHAQAYVKENGQSNHTILHRTKSPLTSELHYRLEESYEQLRCLEKERKKTEAEVSHLWSGRRLSAGNATNLRLPPNPSRVDKLIVDHLREHAKVEALVGRIERIRHSPLHVSISEGVDQWQCSVRELQGRRKEELSNGSGSRGRLNSGLRHQDSAELSALISAVKKLTLSTRSTRTTVWCANQLVLANSMPSRSSFQEGENVIQLGRQNSKEGTGEVS